mmetsp:Transcript_16200/g.26990  ORF Transcript_16200/g.26990 Transcript_16200/m.26990 type:complete len:174 (-) Transcript_16200:367-888(-)|eukprot:CAMPEP_0119317224 /NCGR_PEP_ID=MMETSP1333-20130426/42417_1 /TAXON_ID=418940 /ORGANISM="Scyphosphaera apsteinii, Strain RCC1455" /LENGTH=173 /DNA_ID=CAMNT_0007323097 /DNA_START=22 /DNA_END=543 /DNA_ORIENTATION=-
MPAKTKPTTCEWDEGMVWIVAKPGVGSRLPDGYDFHEERFGDHYLFMGTFDRQDDNTAHLQLREHMEMAFKRGIKFAGGTGDYEGSDWTKKSLLNDRKFRDTLGVTTLGEQDSAQERAIEARRVARKSVEKYREKSGEKCQLKSPSCSSDELHYAVRLFEEGRYVSYDLSCED